MPRRFRGTCGGPGPACGLVCGGGGAPGLPWGAVPGPSRQGQPNLVPEGEAPLPATRTPVILPSCPSLGETHPPPQRPHLPQRARAVSGCGHQMPSSPPSWPCGTWQRGRAARRGLLRSGVTDKGVILSPAPGWPGGLGSLRQSPGRGSWGAGSLPLGWGTPAGVEGAAGLGAPWAGLPRRAPRDGAAGRRGRWARGGLPSSSLQPWLPPRSPSGPGQGPTPALTLGLARPGPAPCRQGRAQGSRARTPPRARARHPAPRILLRSLPHPPRCSPPRLPTDPGAPRPTTAPGQLPTGRHE